MIKVSGVSRLANRKRHQERDRAAHPESRAEANDTGYEKHFEVIARGGHQNDKTADHEKQFDAQVTVFGRLGQ
ncbi:hypothetical protein D3C86_1773190 [compost metagenome]